MILTLIIKNLFFLLKNCLTILNLIKNKNIYYLIFFISIYLFILPNVAYCETVDIEKPLNELSVEDQQKRSKLLDNIFIILFGIAFLILFWDLLSFLFDSDDDSNFYDSDSSLDEVKPPVEPYRQGPGHHFFVRDMGIRYDDDLYSNPGVDVTKTNLYDPKDGPIQVPDIPKYDLTKPFPRSPFDKTPLDSIPETLTPKTPKSKYEFIFEEINVDE